MASTWTSTTLATHVLGSLDQDLNSESAVPDRLIAIAHDAYQEIWAAHEWTMRYSGTEYTWEPGEETVIALLEAPALTSAVSPIWDKKFDPGWLLLTLAKAQQQYRNDSEWLKTQDGYEKWLERRYTEDDEQYWTDLVAASNLNMWSLAGMTRQVCIEVIKAKSKETAMVASKRTLLAMVGNLVSSAYMALWTMHHWSFRRTRATLTATADTATLALPDDFDCMDDRWMEDEADQGEFQFTTDSEQFEALRRANDDATGTPELALIEPDGSGGWQLRFCPAPDSADSYVIVYFSVVTPLASAGVPAWPTVFHKGWQALSRLEGHRRFGTENGARIASREFKDWYEGAMSTNDKQLSRPQRIERDPYADFGNEYASMIPDYPNLS